MFRFHVEPVQSRRAGAEMPIMVLPTNYPTSFKCFRASFCSGVFSGKKPANSFSNLLTIGSLLKGKVGCCQACAQTDTRIHCSKLMFQCLAQQTSNCGLTMVIICNKGTRRGSVFCIPLRLHQFQHEHRASCRKLPAFYDSVWMSGLFP